MSLGHFIMLDIRAMGLKSESALLQLVSSWIFFPTRSALSSGQVNPEIAVAEELLFLNILEPWLYVIRACDFARVQNNILEFYPYSGSTDFSDGWHYVIPLVLKIVVFKLRKKLTCLNIFL